MTDIHDNGFQAFQFEHKNKKRDALIELAFKWREHANENYRAFKHLEHECAHGNAINQHFIKLLTEHKITFNINDPEIIESARKAHKEGSQIYLNNMNEFGRLSVKEARAKSSYNGGKAQKKELPTKEFLEALRVEYMDIQEKNHGIRKVHGWKKYARVKLKENPKYGSVAYDTINMIMEGER